MLCQLFPEGAFHGAGSPNKIMIDDSMAEGDGLKQTCPAAD